MNSQVHEEKVDPRQLELESEAAAALVACLKRFARRGRELRAQYLNKANHNLEYRDERNF